MENKLNVNIGGKEILCDKYLTLSDVLDSIGLQKKDKRLSYDDNPIIGCVVNGEERPLMYSLSANANITPIRTYENLGRRIYRHSLCFLLFASAFFLDGECKLVIGHSLGNGYYLSRSDGKKVGKAYVERLKEKMKELSDDGDAISYENMGGREAVEYFKKIGNKESELLLLSRNESLTKLYRYKEFRMLSYEPISPSFSLISKYEVLPYEDGILLRYPVSSSIDTISPFKDNKMLFSVFKEYKEWNKILGVRSIGELNELIKNGNIKSYVKLSEDLQKRKISSLADDIVRKGSKLVFIAGPSSSGKTTFALRLCEELTLLGYKCVKISLDDYYNPPWMAPLDENGERDLEDLRALNLDLIHSQMKDLLDEKEVHLASYNFITHETTFKKEGYIRPKNGIVVCEGIHALNDEISSDLDKDSVYKIYISALTQLNIDDNNRVSTSDNRLIRRILRDARTRGMSPVRTLNIWKSVQDGERKNIFPYQDNADGMFNSALDYELSVLSGDVSILLRSVKEEDGEAYTTSRRLLLFLDNFYPLSSSIVPSDSILREFIGSSDYEV